MTEPTPMDLIVISAADLSEDRLKYLVVYHGHAASDENHPAWARRWHLQLAQRLRDLRRRQHCAVMALELDILNGDGAGELVPDDVDPVAWALRDDPDWTPECD